jgi:predicted O-methyltransferase YrrM
MNNIIDPIYKIKCSTASDINEHLPILYEYALKVKTIVEFGTRHGCSTWALLNSNPETIVSYDIIKQDGVDLIVEKAKEANINYSFIESDTLSIDIDKTDLLLIDTFHSYNQLYSELNKHHANVNNYIIMHDTFTFGEVDMPKVGPISPLLNQDTIKQGLNNAIKDFLSSNKEWIIEKIFNNNNGLTILKKLTA